MVSARDERRHRAAELPGWREWWGFDFASERHDLAGWAELVVFPGAQIAWYHAFVTGAHRQMVAVFDHEVPLPAPTLELRTDGLWADHICETPGVHWTIGLEAFGVGLDDPAQMYGRQLGDPVPLGFDMEWESDDVAASTIESVDGAISGYALACEVSGEVLIGSEVVDVNAAGTRHHRWGVSTAPVTTVAGRSVDADTVVVEAGADAMPVAITVDDTPVEIVAVTPLALPDPLGALKRPRAVVRSTESADDWCWIDWTE